jgi:hypothetical protein
MSIPTKSYALVSLLHQNTSVTNGSEVEYREKRTTYSHMFVFKKPILFRKKSRKFLQKMNILTFYSTKEF